MSGHVPLPRSKPPCQADLSSPPRHLGPAVRGHSAHLSGEQLVVSAAPVECSLNVHEESVVAHTK